MRDRKMRPRVFIPFRLLDCVGQATAAGYAKGVSRVNRGNDKRSTQLHNWVQSTTAASRGWSGTHTGTGTR